MDNYSVSSDLFENMPVLVIEGDMTSESDSDVMKTYGVLEGAAFSQKYNHQL